MFEFLYQWITNITSYLVIITAVIHVLPENNYKKYIRFFTGLILVFLLSAPILKVFGMERTFYELYEGEAYRQQIREMEDAKGYIEEIFEEEAQEDETEH